MHSLGYSRGAGLRPALPPLLLSLFLLCAAVAPAQDLRSVTSPDGQIAFQVFVAHPVDPQALFRIAYSVRYRGKQLLDTSFLGMDIYNQPTLGENAGLMSSHTAASGMYRSLTAEYIQNGSLGRRINVEARVFDGGVAFRYVVPRSTPLDEIFIENEATEFSFPAGAVTYPMRVHDFHSTHAEPGKPEPLSQLSPEALLALPFVVEVPDTGWVAVHEVPTNNYPHLLLTRSDPQTMIATIAPRPGEAVVVKDRTPLTTPWRVLLIAPSRESLPPAEIIGEITR